MKISLIQLDAGDDIEANCEKAKEYVLKAIDEKAEIICLPENFLYQGDNVGDGILKIGSPYVSVFQGIAKENSVSIILGSIKIRANNCEKPTNTCLVLDRFGSIVYRYDKIYMYDVDRDDLVIRESDSVQPGNNTDVFELEGVKMGVGICVDLRYPEYFRELTKLGAEVIFLPSNFRKSTGLIAWDVLPRARAIENQLFFAACCQTGQTGIKERCGNSSIISFDGKVLSSLGEEEGIVTAEIDFNELRKFRKQFPVLSQVK